jgi:hypothetical protein
MAKRTISRHDRTLTNYGAIARKAPAGFPIAVLTGSSSFPVHFKIRTQSCPTTKVATPEGDSQCIV